VLEKAMQWKIPQCTFGGTATPSPAMALKASITSFSVATIAVTTGLKPVLKICGPTALLKQENTKPEQFAFIDIDGDGDEEIFLRDTKNSLGCVLSYGANVRIVAREDSKNRIAIFGNFVTMSVARLALVARFTPNITNLSAMR
jgi:hypothetical protein